MKMLPHCTLFCVLMLIVVSFCQVSVSYKPIMIPDSEELVIDEGKPLNITCLSYTEIKFEYPDDPKIKTSNYTIYYDYIGNSIRNYTFQRAHTVFSDTGWYSCADINVEITRNTYNPEVKWLYVYVRSNKNAFIEANTITTLLSGTTDSMVIPCRTTSPFLRPTLIKIYNRKDQVHKASFDSKIGFTITNLTLEDRSWCKCSIMMDDIEQTVEYWLIVQPKAILHEPTNLRLYYKRKRNLYVNCTVEMEIPMQYEFKWNTPQQNNNRSIQEFKKQHDNNTVITSQLTIFDVTEKDSGYYWCILHTNINTIHDIKKIGNNILIPNQEKMYIKLISDTKSYRKESGSDVEWTVFAYYKFPIILQWFKPNGEEIVHSPKYFISFKFKPNNEENAHYQENVASSRSINITEVHLKIISLSVLDSGNYILQAKNPYSTKTLNMTLDVTDKPISTLMSIDSHYLHNAREFRCKVTSNPPPNITWSFLKCPNYTSCENSTIAPLMIYNVTQSAVYNSSYIIESIAKPPNDSRKITCEACNEIGCNSVTIFDNILVSDGLDAFNIIGPKESVLKGDNVELVCAASIHNYINELTWTTWVNQTEEPLVETERLMITTNEMLFTHRSTLKLNNVQESDAKNYFCTGKLTNPYLGVITISNPKVYELVIHNPVPPYFTKTNMNKNKTRIIDITESHNKMILQCYVNGMPKPTITWYKDNILLKENEQYSFKYTNQELHIKYLMQHDIGNYSCRAVSRLGTIETYQQIIVKYTKWYTFDIVLVTTISMLGFILIILMNFFMIKIYGEKKMRKEAGLMHFEEGAIECINPDLTVDEQAGLLPYDKKWEFPRERLKLEEQLGSGQFGVVMKAEAIGICKNENVTTVAVKMVHRTTNLVHIRALASELKIMVHLGKHLNVVNLLGACTKNISKCELLVIVEYCHFGNIHKYLLRHRHDFINQINPKSKKLDFTIDRNILTRIVSVSNDSLNVNSNSSMVQNYCPKTNPNYSEINFLPDCVLNSNSCQPEGQSTRRTINQKNENYFDDYKDQNIKPIRTQDLLSWAFQVARGMEYLSQRKILHGDLAARNILLAKDNIVKICDFGLAKNIYKDGNYKKKGNDPVPIKWMAIESIRDRLFSTQSDVWSFGIMLWEFFTLAKTPYHDMEVEVHYQKLIEGYRLEQPNYAIDEIYDIMLQCWIAKPTLRPSFTDLVESIGNLLEESVRNHYIILNKPYMDINMMNFKNGKNDYLMIMSAPDHTVLSDYGCMKSLSKVFSPIPHEDHSNIELLSPTSDSEDVINSFPMLEHEEDPYLKPINVQERRAKFAQQRRAMENQMVDELIDQKSVYCNVPRNSI